ncbi:hypothetical protein CAL26_23685 [Bordetella genomosp. 9]|uniref:Uncharacterized protein n=1 Tax=Bordetella genomosp. 9 TaxID=1416803 RepID=A0A261R655_9BORD|nr:hypothetical protein [Bordetella genomosp. 9]OZI20499.1 hypothetical protein CAL26_23685 [Bordetella genomosp. 9]
MPTTLSPGLLQSLQVAGQQADQARRQREMMLQQQQQQQQRQGGGINPSMINQFLPKAGGNTALGSTNGMTGTWLPVSQAGGLGGLGGLTAAPGVSLAGSGAATSGIGAGGTLGAFAGGGGTAAGGAAGGSAAASGASLGWPLLAAAVIANESYAKNHGYRRDGADYWKDLATGRVLSQDVDKRWSPMLFGKNDNMGFGHDMSFAADAGSFQFGKAFKDLKDSSLLTGFGLFG